MFVLSKIQIEKQLIENVPEVFGSNFQKKSKTLEKYKVTTSEPMLWFSIKKK